MSTAVLASHRDDASGAIIASLSIPWGSSKGDNDLGGYHLVWPRDLVETAGGLLAAGSITGAKSVLDYLNDEAPFLRLVEGDNVSLVNKRHIARVTRVK